MNRLAGLMMLVTIFLGLSSAAIRTTADDRANRNHSADAPFLVMKTQRAATVPKGTKFHIRLKDKLSTEESEGSFSGVLDRPVTNNGQVVLSPGVAVFGKFSYKESSGKDGRRPAMTMRLNQLRVGGKKIPIETEVLALGIPVPDDGARLKALDSGDSPGRPLLLRTRRDAHVQAG